MRFLWRDLNTSIEPEVYQMTVSIFGMKCSPAIAGYVLRRTADDNCEGTLKSMAAVSAVKHNFYMDDFLGSEPDVMAPRTMQKHRRI